MKFASDLKFVDYLGPVAAPGKLKVANTTVEAILALGYSEGVS